MTTWYYATKDTPPPASIKLIAFDVADEVIAEVSASLSSVDAAAAVARGTNQENQTRSNLVHQLVATYGNRVVRYEEWHAGE